MPRPTSHAACVDRPDLPHPRRLVALCTALVLLAVVLGPSRAADAIPIVAAVEAEHMGISPGAGGAFSDPTASGRAGLLLWSNGAARATLTAAAPVVGIAVTARGDQCQGMPMMEVRVDGRVVSAAGVSSTTSWGTRNIAVTLPAGARTVEVAFTNDHLTATCDRNLRIDRVALLLSSVLADNPVARLPLHVSRWTAAGAAADQIRASRPVDAGRLDLLASTPTARWFGEWSGDVRAAVDRYVSEAATDRRLPVLVAYAIPQRDCSSYSGGGMTSAAAYRAWIRELAAGIGTRPAVVILEPDAVALTHCLTSARRARCQTGNGGLPRCRALGLAPPR